MPQAQAQEAVSEVQALPIIQPVLQTAMQTYSKLVPGVEGGDDMEGAGHTRMILPFRYRLIMFWRDGGMGMRLGLGVGGGGLLGVG